jgi:hypothetical protein
MSPKVNSEIAVIGIDLGKNSYHLGGPGSALQPCQQSKLVGTPKTKEHAMSQKLDRKVAVIGIDIGKNSFHIVGQDQRGSIVLRQKWSRGQVEARLANMQPCLIGMDPHRLGRSSQGTRFRVRENRCAGAPTCLILAPCSGPSRRGLAMLEQSAR